MYVDYNDDDLRAGNDFVDINIRYKANGYDPIRVAGDEQRKV